MPQNLAGEPEFSGPTVVLSASGDGDINTPEIAAGEGTMNAMAMDRDGQLCCCAISCGAWASLVDDRSLVHKR
jgi:hypothetical protein